MTKTNSNFPRLSRRDFLMSAAAAAAGSVFVPGTAHAAEAFVIHGEGGSWGETQQNVFVRPFAELHKDREFIYASEAASGVVLSKVLLSCGAPEFSVANINTNLGPIIENASCNDVLDPSIVTNLANTAEIAKLKNANGDTYFASSILMVMGLAWNTKEATKPTSWEDMLKPEYKGRIGVPDFAYLGQTWMPALSHHLGGDDTDMAAALDMIEELVKKNDAILIQNTDQAMKLFESEEIVMAPFWNGRTFAMQQRGLPIAMEVVKHSAFNGDGYIPMLNGAGREIAQQFINFNLDGKNALGLTATTGYPPSDRSVELPSEYEAIALSDADLEGLLMLDFKTLGENREENLRIWNERIKA